MAEITTTVDECISVGRPLVLPEGLSKQEQKDTWRIEATRNIDARQGIWRREISELFT
jgi:hypothetical protein